MKKALFIIFGLIISAALLFMIAPQANAEGEFIRDLMKTDIVIECKGQKISNIYSDPVSYYEEAASGFLNTQEIRYSATGENDIILYTANYPLTSSNRSGSYTEYACTQSSGKYYVSEINTDGLGKTYIPIGGFVLSVPEDLYQGFASIGDEITFMENAPTIATKAVESESGKRIVVNNTNTTRSGPMVVYYDYQFGEKTGTNIYGTEMTCVYDFEENSFVVKRFRGFGTGDDSGSVIPDNSFVLSAYGEGYRGLLVKNELFEVGDKVKMVGFDFIRFGGTTYGDYDFINPTPEENPKGMETETSAFPAYRGENQTIIYKYGWSYNGASGTGTNVYGYEAAVDSNGVVVELNVNVSNIPEGGYVISGHGSGRDFIRSNIVLGATIVLDESNKTYSISTTLNSYYENLVTSVNQAVENAKNKMKQLYDLDYDSINNYISTVSGKLDALKTVKEEIEAGLDAGLWNEEEKLSHLMTYNSYQIEIEKLEHLIIESSVESKTVSSKAVWHRPTEFTYAEIEETMKTYSEVGINLIFVETLYNGYSTFKSDYSDYFPYNNKLSDTYTNGEETYSDYLSCFSALADKYGIEVHAWVENFYVGTLNTVKIISEHPDWILYNSDDTYIQKNEGGAYIFIDPANKEVQDLLINYYNDLFKKCSLVKGLNLDYIRYPVSDESDDVGYTVAAMTGFAALKGMTFSENQLANRNKMAKKFKQLFDKNYLSGGQDEADKNYEEWVNYRTGIITDYVKRIKEEVKKTNDILLSTAVFASLNDSIANKKQDWKTWIENGWIDIATPMAYYTDSTDVLYYVNSMVQSAGDNAYYYAGLASSYSGLPAYRNSEQIEAAIKANAYGYVIFCSTQIMGHDDVQEALSSGVNRTPSVLPHADAASIIKASFDDILSKAERIYIPANGMTDAQLELLKEALSEIEAMPSSSALELYRIKNKIMSLYAKGISAYAKGYSGQRLTENLKYLVEILDTKISRTMIDDGIWDPEIYPNYPIITEDEIKMDDGSEEPDDPTPVDPTPVTPDTNGDNNTNNNETKKGCKSILTVSLFTSLISLFGLAALFIKRKHTK